MKYARAPRIGTPPAKVLPTGHPSQHHADHAHAPRASPAKAFTVVTTAALAPMPGDPPQRRVEDEFTGLFRSYHPQLLRYVTHHFGPRDADEITQEALTRALRSLDRGRSDAETWAWLIRVAKNIAHDVARSRRICDSTDDDAVLRCDPPADTALPEPAVLLDERRHMVRRALKVLPPTQRRILVLYEVDDLTCPTIADLVGSTEDAVRKSLQRARRRFAAEVKALGGGSAAITWWVRGLRRRPRGLSALGASTALCAVAGGVALTVATSPVAPVLTPRVAAPVTARSYEAPAGAAPEAGPKTVRAVPSTATRSGAPDPEARPAPPKAPTAKNVVVIPKSKIPGRGRTEVEQEVKTSAGNVVVKDTIVVDGEEDGIVCSLPGVGCE